MNYSLLEAEMHARNYLQGSAEAQVFTNIVFPHDVMK